MKHTKEVHGIEAQNLECGFCGKMVLSVTEYTAHMEKFHKEEEKKAEQVVKAPKVKKKEEKRCRNGPQCTWRREGRCKFIHPEGEVHREEETSREGNWESQRKNGFKRHQGGAHQGGVHQGAVHQGAVHQGGVHQGAVHQGSVHQGAVYQGGVHQGAVHQGGVHQGAVHQGGVHQGSVHQGGVHQGEERRYRNVLNSPVGSS